MTVRPLSDQRKSGKWHSQFSSFVVAMVSRVVTGGEIANIKLSFPGEIQD